MRSEITVALALGLGLASGSASAAVVTDIVVNPLTGSAATPGDGLRTIVNSGLALESFEVGANGDVFRFLLSAFGIEDGLDFISAAAGRLPAAGVNLIVLQDTEDASGAGLNAGSAANLIAAEIETDAPGFFIYFNAGLRINRLVFSENLNLATADLAILAAISNPKDEQAIAELPAFSNFNFASFAEDAAQVPLPASAWLLTAALAGLGALRRRV